MFTIKEVSERLGYPASTIRYYEKEGLLPNIQRDKSGNRLFNQEDLNWIRLMTCFRATGMKIADLRNIVNLALQGDSTIEQRQEILNNHKKELIQRQKELNEAFKAVNYKLDKYNEIQNKEIEEKEAFKMDNDSLPN
jgi:MerR family transcriptional regulator, aldehyde-responsive regulator